MGLHAIHSIAIAWSVFTPVRPESSGRSNMQPNQARFWLGSVGLRRLAEVDERQEEQAVASWLQKRLLQHVLQFQNIR